MRKPTPSERWESLSPPERLKEYCRSFGFFVAQVVAASVLVITGAEMFFAKEVGAYIQLDQTRAQDIFFGLCGYYGIPLLVGKASRSRGG